MSHIRQAKEDKGSVIEEVQNMFHLDEEGKGKKGKKGGNV